MNKRNKLAKLDTINNYNEAKILDLHISKILAKEGVSNASLFKKLCDKNGATDVTAMWKLKR